MKTILALAAILTFMLLAACGPAAPAGQNSGALGNGLTPQDNVQPDRGPATPGLPQETEPTATPKPPPTPVPHIGEEEPSPTSPPEPSPHPVVPLPAEPILEPVPVPEGGVDACYGINPYLDIVETLEYMHWCQDALVDDVVDNCSGTGNSEAELTCARKRLADVEMYFLREVMVPCFAITDRRDRLTCGEATSAAAGKHTRALWATWAEILQAVDSYADVKVRKAAMADCLVAKGYPRPEPGQQLHWQEFRHSDDSQALMQQTETVRAATIDRLTATHECAEKAELYMAQEQAWLVEIYRLGDTAPAKVKPLIDEGVVAALEAEGIAPFLTPGH